MGLKKGQASEAFKQGKMEKYNFKNLPPEKLKEYSQKAVQARKERAEKRKSEKEQMELLLKLDVKSKKHKDSLRQMGLEDAEIDNQMLLMVALYQSALRGNVEAVKQVFQIVNGEKEEQQGYKPPTINVIAVDSKKVSANSEEDEEDWDDEWEE